MLTSIFTVLFLCSFGQDKIILLTGESIEGTVTEIGGELVKYRSGREKQSVSTQRVLLIEFANGYIELVNRPTENTSYVPEGIDNKPANKRQVQNAKKLSKDNLISLNTLALCNSDISLFYERLFNEKRIGLGAMGAYNFNSSAGLINNHIVILNNAKKNYDLGATLNFYFDNPARNKRNYLGVLLKYTDISFSKTILSGSAPNITISYKPASGSQISTILTVGSERMITDNFFIKTIYGIGGFGLRGDYKTEFNYMLNRDVGQGQRKTERDFLLKFYFGINTGFNF